MNDYPRNWIWDEDGSTAEGLYESFSVGHTQAGDVIPILILRIGGESRSIWLFWDALRSKIRDEIKTRPDADLDPGERVKIQKGSKRQSQSNPDRSFLHLDIEFENKRRLSPLELLAVPQALGATQPPPPGDDLPF